MIEIHGDPTSQAAVIVLTEVRGLVAQHHNDAKKREGWITVEHYVNCREQGYSLEAYLFNEDKTGVRGSLHDSRHVSFSEHRSSDDIVVYYGVHEDFAFNTNIICEEKYETNRKYFRRHQYKEAAEFVYNYLIHGKVE